MFISNSSIQFKPDNHYYLVSLHIGQKLSQWPGLWFIVNNDTFWQIITGHIQSQLIVLQWYSLCLILWMFYTTWTIFITKLKLIVEWWIIIFRIHIGIISKSVSKFEVLFQLTPCILLLFKHLFQIISHKNAWK